MHGKGYDWITRLKLQPHPEGGWFRETYRTPERIEASALPARFQGDRTFSTAIYFLLEGTQFSAFHSIKSDEIWHFYDGDTLNIHVISPDGEYSRIRLGRNPGTGEVLQAVVSAGCWFGAELEYKERFALVGCTVAPGFDFDDFEIAARDDLLSQYPQLHDIIKRLS